MSIRESRDKAEIERFILSDRAKALYHLGDLDGYYFKKCEWYIIDSEEIPVTLILLYRTWGVSLLPLGLPTGLRFFLEEKSDSLPPEIYSLWMTEHDAVMKEFFDIPVRKSMYRMMVTRGSFLPFMNTQRVVELNETDADAIRGLLRSYPDNFFEEYQLRTGYYRGIFDGERLVSMAGIHTVNRDNRIAAIGNIVTDEQYRCRGLASAVTSKLVSDLLRDLDLIGLNVNQGNRPAIRIYQKLGFAIGAEFFEGVCRGRRPAAR